MKIFSKMSARDRSLIILLLAAVIFYLCYTFIMSPQLEMAQVLKTNLTSAQEELSNAVDISGKADQLQDQERKQREELINKFSGFFFDLDQSRLLNKVDLLMVGSGLPPASYTPTPELASQVLVEKGAYMSQEYPLKELARKINPELQEAAPETSQGGNPAANGEQAPTEAVQAADMVLGTDVSIGFSGASYESVFNFINSVEKMKKTVVLKSIDITKGELGLEGQLVYSFYSLPKLDSNQEDGLDYNPTIPAGKPNPFL